MVYVMLSRVCSISQIFILNGFVEAKMYPNENAMAELLRIETLNSDRNYKREVDLRIYSLNCRSLGRHFEDILSDSRIHQSKIICLQETWTVDDDCSRYELPTYTYHPNSFGRGKGIAIFYREEIFEHVDDLKKENMQLTKLSSIQVDVITVYRSQNCPYDLLNAGIKKLITNDKPTLIIGDFNFCYKEQATPTKKYLLENNLVQLIKEPTHIGGHILDQAYLKDDMKSIESCIEIDSKYYSDHRGLSVTLREKGKFHL